MKWKDVAYGVVLVLGAWALALVLSGCGNQDPQTFEISVESGIELVQGETATVQITVDRAGGYGDPVEVRVDSLPEFVTAAPLTIARAETVGELELTATLNAVQAEPITITVIARGSIEVSADTDLLVRGPAGSLDLTFGHDGRTLHDFGAESDLIRALAVQADGKIVVAGRGINAGNSFFAIARYEADGTLDPSFGTAGIVTTDVSGNGFDQANAIAIGANGEIIVAGIAQGIADDIAIARYDSAGALDATFGGGGIVLTDANGNDDFANAVALQPDGSLLVAGLAINPGTGPDFVVARYDSLGSLDASFGNAGLAFHDTANLFDAGASMHLQADGNIIVAGSTENVATGVDFGVIRLMGTDGTLDTSFGTTGAVGNPFSQFDDFASASAMQTDGKIVTVGRSSADDVVLTRFNTDGSLDTTFGTGTGISAYDLTGVYDNPNAVALQADGKIVVAGESTFGSNEDFTVARFNDDGSLDTSFAGGVVSVDFNNGFDQIFAIAIQADGRILVAGRAFNGTDQDFALARFWQ